ncbi:PucR family transcriptional regulator [Actinokineospora sp. 24-640]
MSVMLSHLLAVGFFPDPLLIAPDRGLTTPVTSVTSPPGPLAVAEVAPSALAVFDRSRLRAEDSGTGVAIRLAGQRGAAGLLLQRPPGLLARETRLLAEEAGVALILVDHEEPDRLVPAMDSFVRTPDVTDFRVLSVLAHRLRSVRVDPEEMVDVLARTLRHPVALVDPEGRVLAGVLPPAAAYRLSGARGRLSAVHPMSWVCSASDDGHELVVAQAVQLAVGAPANLWLVATVPGTSSARVHLASQALGIATWAFVAYLATTALRVERRVKHREELLTRLMEDADAPSRGLLEQATAAGWRLGGWHTGIHVASRGGVDPAMVRDRLRDCLRADGVRANPIGDGDGWSLWITRPTRPPADADSGLLNCVQRALINAERECGGVRLCAGIGVTAEGIAGLRATLREARQASVLASARNIPGAVERVGGDNVKRLLADRYVTNLQHTLAHQLLGPLIEADASGQLMQTLSSYFDHNASTTATATVLGVHRNTVLQRLDRIRAVLAVDLTNADDRLALHLAVRLVQSAPPGQAARPDDER